MTTNYKPQLLRALNVVLSISLIVTIGYLMIRFLFPFVIIIIFSALLQKPIAYLKHILRVNRTAAVLISITMCLAILIFSFSLAIIHLIDRFNAMLVKFPIYLNTIINAFKIGLDYFVNDTLSNLESLLNHLDFSLSSYLISVMDNLYEIILTFCQKLANQLMPFISESILLTIEITSSSVMVLILTILLSKDWHIYVSKLGRVIPEKTIKKASEVRRTFAQIGWGYLKVELIVSSATTFILMIGFYLLEIESPFILALSFGLIDLIPLIGVGLMLWPWMFYSLITGNFLLTIYLSIMYIIIVCIRQFLEPRLVSKQTGTNSLFVIALGYLCYLSFGIYGVLFTPIVLISIQTIKSCKLDQIIFNYIRFGKQAH